MLSPQSADRRLSVEVNYFDIKVDGRDPPIGAATSCSGAARQRSTRSVATDHAHGIRPGRAINGLLQNIASIDTEGIDVTLSFRTPDMSFGTIGLYWSSTFLLDYTETVPATVGAPRSSAREPSAAAPTRRSRNSSRRAMIDWSSGPVRRRSPAAISMASPKPERQSAGDRFYGDISWSIRPLGSAFRIAVGVNNLFDTILRAAQLRAEQFRPDHVRRARPLPLRPRVGEDVAFEWGRGGRAAGTRGPPFRLGL